MEAAHDGDLWLALRVMRLAFAALAAIALALGEPAAARGLFKTAALHLSRAGTLLDEIMARRRGGVPSAAPARASEGGEPGPCKG